MAQSYYFCYVIFNDHFPKTFDLFIIRPFRSNDQTLRISLFLVTRFNIASRKKLWLIWTSCFFLLLVSSIVDILKDSWLFIYILLISLSNGLNWNLLLVERYFFKFVRYIQFWMVQTVGSIEHQIILILHLYTHKKSLA